MIVMIIVIIINIMIMIIIIFTISPILLPRSHMKYNAVIIDTMVMIAMQRYGDWWWLDEVDDKMKWDLWI